MGLPEIGGFAAVELARLSGDWLREGSLLASLAEAEEEHPIFSKLYDDFRDAKSQFFRDLSTGNSIAALKGIEKLKAIRGKMRGLIDSGVNNRLSVWGMESADLDMEEIMAQEKSLRSSFRDRSTARALRNVQPMSDSEYFRFAVQAEQTVGDDERRGLRLYSHGSYSDFNPAMRAAGPAGVKQMSGRFGDLGHQIKYIDSIGEAIERTALPRDVMVFRVVQDSEEGTFRGLRAGDTFGDHAFVSTTSNRSILDRFYQGSPEARVDLEIILRRGSKGFPISQFSKYKDEREILLGANQRMRVIGFTQGRGHHVLQVERI